MRNEDFIHIAGWMVPLGLTQRQLMLYALLLNMTKGGISRFHGSAKYLADWIGCKERQTQNIIRQLEERGLLAHEVVFDRTRRCPVSKFWALYPDQISPRNGEDRERISWSGSRKGLRKQTTQRIAYSDYATDCVNHTGSNNNSRDRSIKNCGGKNSARSRAKTTTTTGFLFENSDTGQQAGNPSPLTLPFEESYFRDAWEMLLRQPAWAGKSPEALAIQLEEFQECGDPVLATYCIRLAIKKGWSDIKDIQAIFTADMDQVLAFADVCNARREEGKA